MPAAIRDTCPVTKTHQSTAPWLTRLGSNQVLTLPAERTPRWLQVEQGCLWVTAAQQQDPSVPPEADIWLRAGESLSLAAHSAWMLQAWPGAQVLIVQAAPVSFGRPTDAARSHAWQRLWAVGQGRGTLSALAYAACRFRKVFRISAAPSGLASG